MGRVIENEQATELVVKTQYAKHWDNPDRMGGPGLEGDKAVREFAGLLRALGMEVKVHESATTGECVLTVKHPDRREATRLRNRGGGQVQRPMHRDSPLQRMSDEEKLAWLVGHDMDEGREALGTWDEEAQEVVPVSRPTYYRRLKELRERIASREEMGRTIKATRGELGQSLEP